MLSRLTSFFTLQPFWNLLIRNPKWRELTSTGGPRRGIYNPHYHVETWCRWWDYHTIISSFAYSLLSLLNPFLTPPTFLFHILSLNIANRTQGIQQSNQLWHNQIQPRLAILVYVPIYPLFTSPPFQMMTIFTDLLWTKCEHNHFCFERAVLIQLQFNSHNQFVLPSFALYHITHPILTFSTFPTLLDVSPLPLPPTRILPHHSYDENWEYWIIATLDP